MGGGDMKQQQQCLESDKFHIGGALQDEDEDEQKASWFLDRANQLVLG